MTDWRTKTIDERGKRAPLLDAIHKAREAHMKKFSKKCEEIDDEIWGKQDEA